MNLYPARQKVAVESKARGKARDLALAAVDFAAVATLLEVRSDEAAQRELRAAFADLSQAADAWRTR